MAEIYGRGTDFRFITCWDYNEWGQVKAKYTFLLHKHTVLVGEHDEREFTITDKGELLIYKTDDRWYTKPKQVNGIVFPADTKMVKELKEALMDDWVEEVVLT
jgi:succinylglutamate desuccinylase